MNEIKQCEQAEWFRKALFGLAWYHALLIERKKFKTLGYNIVYKFNDSDFNVCSDLIADYMGARDNEGKFKPHEKNINWQAIQFLIAEANYGGRVTDDYDRLLIKTYAIDIFKVGEDLNY
jgi:dynein heavy chain